MTAAPEWTAIVGEGLPEFTAAEAYAHRQWARHGLRTPTGPWQLRQPDRLEDPFGRTGRFRIAYRIGRPDAVIALDLGDDAYSILLAGVIGQTQPDLLDAQRATQLTLGVVAYRARALVSGLLGSLGLATPIDVVTPLDGGLVIGATALPGQVDLWLTTTCAVPGIERNGTAALHVPWSVVEACLPQAAEERRRVLGQAVDRYRTVTAELSFSIGIARLSLDDLRGLRVGDAMPLQGYAGELQAESDATGAPLLLPGTATRIVLRGGGIDGNSRFGWDGVVLDGRRPLRIKLGYWCPRPQARSEEMIMADENGRAAGDIPPAPETGSDDALGTLADEIPVELVAEIGRVSLALSELAGLHAGQVIAFERGLNEPVRLTANGQFVATGRLMQSHGRIGVQIVSIPGHAPTGAGLDG